MVKRIIVSATIPGLVALALLASGCRHDRPSAKAAFVIDYLAESLDLTEAQKARLESIREEIQQKALAMRQDHQAMQAQIVAQLKSETIDRDALKTTLTTHREQMDRLVELLIDRLAEFHQTLAPEQREKLVSKLEQFRKWHRPGWE
jgi:Spy/CpxP family protein refolding chaperone